MAPYPRFPPYDRMGYYNQNLDVYSRPDSPSSQVGVPVGAAANNNNNSSSNNNNSNGMLQQQNGTTALSGGHPQPHPQQQPIVYASCKLQAAVGAGGGGGMMIGDGGSPPLEQLGGHHHMGAQMTIPNHHHMGGQPQVRTEGRESELDRGLNDKSFYSCRYTRIRTVWEEEEGCIRIQGDRWVGHRKA